MRLKTRKDQTLSVAAIMHANVRTPHYYRNQVRRQLDKKERANPSAAKQKAADLIAKDLPEADKRLDNQVEQYIDSLVRGSNVERPSIDIDWPAYIHNGTYARNIRAKMNPKNDPLLGDVLDYAAKVRDDIHKLARRLDIHFSTEHRDA